MPWYKSLHNQIFLGILLGVAFGCLALDDGSLTITTEPHDPVLPVTVLGQFFLAALKMIVPPSTRKLLRFSTSSSCRMKS